MRTNTRFLTALAVCMGAMLAAQPAAAQICSGQPTLQGARSVNVSSGASFFDGGKTYGANFTVGSEWLVGGGFGYTDFDDTTLSQKTISGVAGWEYEDGSGFAACPNLGASYGFGLELSGVDLTSWTISPGVSLGYEAMVSQTLSVVPTGSGSLVYQDLTADAGIGGEASDSETYGMIGLGLGLIVNDLFGFGPSVSFPLGLDGGDTRFGLSATVGIGN